MSSANSTTRKTIAAKAAMQVLQTALDEAESMDVGVTVAVVDSSGTLVAFARGDAAPIVSVELAQRKAHTVVAVGGVPTTELSEIAASSPAHLHSFPQLPGMTLLGGGLPLRDGDTLIGGVGVSGATTEQDVEIAEAASAALG
jgi:uncharacterized protein GlcG (DUF336 family)